MIYNDLFSFLYYSVAKDVNVVDTYPIDYFVDPEEKYKFDKILP